MKHEHIKSIKKQKRNNCNVVVIFKTLTQTNKQTNILQITLCIPINIFESKPKEKAD